MSNRTIRKLIIRWITSSAYVRMSRKLANVKAAIKRENQEILYFHRVDDPYCQLFVQLIPDLISRFNMPIKPLVVERLPANMYPDPERYEQYTALDARRLARLFGLGFAGNVEVPDRLAVGMANRFLASKQDDPDFYSIAEEIGAAIWQRDLESVRRICGLADMGEQRLIENEKLLVELGHYASASLYYRGEFYAGIDRIDHLERRLRDEGLGDGKVELSGHRYWRKSLADLPETPHEPVEFFFSPRSPYSYLGLCYMKELMDAGVKIIIRPVLPMLMRGMKVPPTKGLYIIKDTAREAGLNAVQFGNVCDPLGDATWRALEIGFGLMEAAESKLVAADAPFEFFLAFAKGVWSEGMDGTSNKVLSGFLAAAGLDASWLQQALPRGIAKDNAEANVHAMFEYGSWGVPTMHVAGKTMWGQDRMWAVLDVLQEDGSEKTTDEGIDTRSVSTVYGQAVPPTYDSK